MRCLILRVSCRPVFLGAELGSLSSRALELFGVTPELLLWRGLLNRARVSAPRVLTDHHQFGVYRRDSELKAGSAESKWFSRLRIDELMKLEYGTMHFASGALELPAIGTGVTGAHSR